MFDGIISITGPTGTVPDTVLRRGEPMSVEDVEQTIRLLIQSQLASGGSHRLPSLKTLAVLTGAGRVVVREVIERLAREGVLRVRPRGGVFIQTAPRPDSTRKSRSTEVARDIEKEILTGNYPPNTLLPPITQLCAGLCVSFRTMSAALSKLCSENVLVREKRGYRVLGSPYGGPSNATILVAGAPLAERGFRLHLDTPHLGELLRHLERQCMARKLKYVKATLPAPTTGQKVLYLEDGRKLADFEKDIAIIGCIALPLNDFEHQTRLIDALRGYERPLAVFNHDAGYLLRLRYHPLTRHFLPAFTQRPGNDAARYLHQRGHRHVVYISPFHKADWARQRLRGFTDVYAAAGDDDGVTAVTRSEAYDARHLYFLHHKTGVSSGDSMLASEEPVFHTVKPDRAAAFRSMATVLEYSHHYLESCFEEASADKSATAWVCANDTVALAAIEYLVKQGCRIPDDIAVMGFDDTLEAIQANLTSYNFDIAGYASAMLDFVSSNRRLSRGHECRGGEWVELPGMVMERASTGGAFSRLGSL